MVQRDGTIFSAQHSFSDEDVIQKVVPSNIPDVIQKKLSRPLDHVLQTMIQAQIRHKGGRLVFQLALSLNDRKSTHNGAMSGAKYTHVLSYFCHKWKKGGVLTFNRCGEKTTDSFCTILFAFESINNEQQLCGLCCYLQTFIFF